MGAILHLAICKEISGDKFSAKELYKVYGSRESGSHALRESIRGRALYQRNYPATNSSYCDITINNAVVMSRLIAWGRFGNQVLEHFWMTLYSTNHGVKTAVSYWLGRDVFGLVGYILPNAHEFEDCAESDIDMGSSLSHLSTPRLIGRDIRGFCQIHTKHYAPYKQVFRSLYRPIEKLENQLNQFLAGVRLKSSETNGMLEQQQKLLAVHIRRTDYVGSEFDIGEISWYTNWLREMQKKWPKCVI